MQQGDCHPPPEQAPQELSQELGHSLPGFSGNGARQEVTGRAPCQPLQRPSLAPPHSGPVALVPTSLGTAPWGAQGQGWPEPRSTAEGPPRLPRRRAAAEEAGECHRTPGKVCSPGPRQRTLGLRAFVCTKRVRTLDDYPTRPNSASSLQTENGQPLLPGERCQPQNGCPA